MSNFLAPHLASFQQNFRSQLEIMLQSEQLGAFILVLANSLQDKTLQTALSNSIHQRYLELDTSTTHAAADDLYVFSQLQNININALSCWQKSTSEPWQLIYNNLRSMRPARASKQPFEGLYQPFKPDTFNFNKPFLKPEIFWEGTYQNLHCRVLYNKFPFAPWHLLIVPEPEKQQPQYINKNNHFYIQKLVLSSQHLTGFAVGYNSLGAYASVNQLHFQGFIRESPLPIEANHWQHHKGHSLYPLDCHFYNSPQHSWQHIEKLHQQNQPYNLFYTEAGCYVIPQQGQKKILKTTLGNIAWYEACGMFTVTTKAQLTIPPKIISEHLSVFCSDPC